MVILIPTILTRWFINSDSFDNLKNIALAPNTHKFVLNFWDENREKSMKE